MDVAIISALIGVIGSILTTVVGALVTHHLARRGEAPHLRGRGRPTRRAEQQAPRQAPVPEGRRAAPARLGTGSLFVIGTGAFLGFTGFAMAGYVILRFMTAVFATFQSRARVPRPPDLSDIPLVPFLPLGFGLLFAGVVIAWMGPFAAGVSMSRARSAH